ncbi:MAG: hypothetical protein WDM81_05835 [Rhizomicrobium sp.]
MAVAAEERGQADHVDIAFAADDHRTAGAGLQEADAPQDERAHDALAQFRLLDQKIAQALRADDDRLDRGECGGVDQRRLAGKLRQLAHEAAGAVGDDELFAAQRVALLDRDLAGEDQEEPGRYLARAGHGLARGIAAFLAEAAQARKFLVSQMRGTSDRRAS